MFRYVNDVSTLAQNIIKSSCLNFNAAVDATLGNGHDTDFLAGIFEKVYSFDIQKQCINNYVHKNKDNVILINDSHENIEKHINGAIDCAMFNLGFLPGGDKCITTKYESTLKAIDSALKLLRSNGIITIALYPGHEAGKLERDHIIYFASNLPKHTFGVLHQKFINRKNNPPELLVIEKK